MARKTIFLESAFWDKFSECSRALVPFAEGNDPAVIFEKIERWNDLFKFICRSNLLIDSPLQELGEKAKSDQMLKHLLKCNGDGRCELEYQEEPFPDLESDREFEYLDDYTALYFTAINHRDAAQKRGIITICPDTIWDHKNKFIDSGKPVQRDAEWTWREMDILKENSNGLVIIDNYILVPSVDRYTGIEYYSITFNLKELLKLLLPGSSLEPFPISIFYYDNGEDATIEKRKNSYTRSIQEFINHQKPHLKTVLELFPTATNEESRRKDFHDRAIITNNIWVSSEAGFDLLRYDTTRNTNASAIKSTKTHGLYLGFGNETANWLDTAYSQLIKEAKQCLKKYGYKTENRLLQ